MSGHNYFTTNNPQDLFSDVDDEDFLRNARASNSQNMKTPSDNEYLQQRRIFEERRREIEERTLHSTDRSIGLLKNTEAVGAVSFS